MHRGQGWIWSCVLTTVALTVGATTAARSDPTELGPPVCLNIETEWTLPSLPSLPNGGQPESPPIEMEVPGGRILEAVTWPGTGTEEPQAGPNGVWRLGSESKGRVRARVEAAVGGNVIIRAGTQAVAFPVAALLEAPQRSTASSPVAIAMKRLAWDPISIELTDDGDGTLTPEAAVPITVGFNILTSETTEGALRLTGEMRPARGGDPVWRCDQMQAVVSNPSPGRLPTVTLQVQAPRQEGSYVLDLRVTWKSASGPEPSRLSRLIRRRRSTEPLIVQAARRVNLMVVGHPPESKPAATAGPGTIVDAIDLVRPGRHRGMATGRTAMIEPGRFAWPVPDVSQVRADLGDRLRGLVGLGPETASLGPADANGLPWSAVGLRVSHPDQPHRLTLTVASGDPGALGVALVAPDDGQGRGSRVVLDSAGSGPVVTPSAKPVTCSWLVWPGVSNPVLVLVHRGTSSPVRLSSVAMEELAGPPAPASVVEAPVAPRTFGLLVSSSGDLERFGADPLVQGRNLSLYLDHVGATLAVLPASLRDRDRRRSLGGQADEDNLGPDRLELALRILAERKCSALVAVRGEGSLPGLPGPNSSEARQRGLVRLDGQGQADGVMYNPLHPDVRSALERQVELAIAPRRRHANLLGLLIQLGPGATLAGAADTGLDDAGYSQFVKAMLDSEAARQVPGLNSNDLARFAARRQYVTGPGRAPWMTWRAQQIGALYARLADTLKESQPGAMLVVATPTLDDSSAGRAARASDGVGESPLLAWQAVGLNLEQWPADRENLVVLRGVGPMVDPLARDLATHPDLDAPIARRSGRGLLVMGAGARTPDDVDRPILVVPGPPGGGEEPLGHALAALDARWVLLDIAATSGREDRIVPFARVFRALPGPAEIHVPAPGPETGVAARTWTDGNRTILGLANDSPYPIRIEAQFQAPSDASVDDLGRTLRLQPDMVDGNRRLVIDLPSFGVSAVRFGTSEVRLQPVQVNLPEEVVAAQYKVLSARLSRLTQAAGEPVNPGFEPIPIGHGGSVVAEIGGAPPAGAVPAPGWSTSDGASVLIDPERPHSGLGALRLDVKTASAAGISEWFVPPGGTTLELRAWFRADHADAKTRVWVEGESAGQTIVRRAELTVRPDWVEQRIRVSNLPTAGLDRMRLRFDLAVPGRLWVDDLTISGQKPSEPALHAQRILLAAMQKYRERRFADFARLAGSYWAHATATVEPVRTGIATDLPPNRRVR